MRRSAGIWAFLMIVAATETAVSQELLVTLPGLDPLSAIRPDTSQHAFIPMDLGFGEVPVGTASSQVFRITTSETTPLQVFGISILDSGSPPFEITGFSHNGSTSPGTIPTYIFSETLGLMDVPTYLDVEVTFAPTTPGAYSTSAVIHSNDEHYEFIDVPLAGTAVSNVVPEPGSVILWSQLACLGFLGYRVRRRHRSRPGTGRRGSWAATDPAPALECRSA